LIPCGSSKTAYSAVPPGNKIDMDLSFVAGRYDLLGSPFYQEIAPLDREKIQLISKKVWWKNRSAFYRHSFHRRQ